MDGEASTEASTGIGVAIEGSKGFETCMSTSAQRGAKHRKLSPCLKADDG